MKFCIKCSENKNTSLFSKEQGRKDGLRPYCKACVSEHNRVNKDKIAVSKRQTYLKNKDKYNAQKAEYLNNAETWTNKMLSLARTRARLQNREFSLVPEDIIIPTHCPYLGCELTYLLGKGMVDSNASLDRIDSTKGYTPDNVQVMSRLANRMKNNSTADQLIIFAKAILQEAGYQVTKDNHGNQ